MSFESFERNIDPDQDSEKDPPDKIEGDQEFQFNSAGEALDSALGEPENKEEAEWEIESLQGLVEDEETELEEYLERLEKGMLLNPATGTHYTESEIPQHRAEYLERYQARITAHQERIKDLERRLPELPE